MRYSPFFLICLLAAVCCGRKEIPESASENEEISVETVQTEQAVSSKGNGKSGSPYVNHIGRYDEVFNDSNYIQYMSAERLGIDPITSLAEAYNTRRPIVKIESGEYYQVDELTHSMPYLVPEAALLLEEIGRDFSSLLDERGGDSRYSKILVTSLLRSPYTVKKLRRVNRNAVDSSTHMFATTFDISWNNFHYPDSSKMENAVILKGILAEVLKKKRDEGRCLVKYEKKTPCFHITVNN